MDRVQILFLALIGMGALWLIWQGVKLALRRSIRVEGVAGEGMQPSLLYFSSETCAPCRYQQAPAVDALRDTLGDRANFQEYDAVEHHELASKYRVLTVPTTVVIAPGGDVAAINYGFTGADKLARQLQGVIRSGE